MSGIPRAMPYTLTLTAEEYRTLAWMEARGYSADLIRHATEEDTEEDGSTVLRYTEADAWNVSAKAHESHCETCGAALGWDDRPFAGEDCPSDPPDKQHTPTSNGELDDDFGACAGPTLLGKMRAFIDGIV